MADVVKVSAYIIAFAGAARVAQQTMSTGAVPMAIKEYRFKINVDSDMKIENTMDVGLTVYGMKLTNKLTVGYTSSLGVEIECSIVPQVTIVEG
jgi:hypothetical protein